MNKLELTTMVQDTMALSFTEIDNHFPSLYTKEDVKEVLSKFALSINEIVGLKLKTTESKIDHQELLETVLAAVEQTIDRLDSEDIVDYGSAQFTISYSNTVEIDSLDANTSELFDSVSTAINDVFIKEFGETTEEE
jgi:hypothetical protein